MYQIGYSFPKLGIKSFTHSKDKEFRLIKYLNMRTFKFLYKTFTFPIVSAMSVMINSLLAKMEIILSYLYMNFRNNTSAVYYTTHVFEFPPEFDLTKACHVY